MFHTRADRARDDETAARIRRAFTRSAKALTLRPTMGRGTAVTRVRVTDGLACEITDGPWRVVADLGEQSGGTGCGPNPGVLGRGALGACLAMNYVTFAAVRGLTFDDIEVQVQADYDARGQYDTTVSPGYSEIRFVVTVQCDAPEAEVRRVLGEAEEHTTYLDVFAHSQNVRREVHVTTAAGALNQ